MTCPLTIAPRGLGSCLRKAARPALRPPRCRLSSTSAPAQSDALVSKGGEGSLGKIIADTIKATGPMSVSRYMQFCLSHPTEGYYAKGDVFGSKGDFVTSPEISQIFGELLAIWLLTRFEAAGRPEKVRLVELGPGRGTLMDDVLRTLGSFPQMRGRISSIHLVENSIELQDIQRSMLTPRAVQEGIRLEWNDKIDDIPPSDEFTLLLAHEFFDALPINVFEHREGGWREVQIGLAASQVLTPSSSPCPTSPATSSRTSPTFQFVISPDPNPRSTVIPATSPRFAKLPIGSRIEVAPDSWRIMRKAGELIGGKGGGAGLVVDYGADRFFGGSFRAFRNHKITDPLLSPGMCDLTANVDFAYLKEALADTARPLGPMPQGNFLLSLGLQPRLDKLLSSAKGEARRRDMEQGAKRLVDMMGMGGQYQFMGIVPLSFAASPSPSPPSGGARDSGSGKTEEVYPFSA